MTGAVAPTPAVERIRGGRRWLSVFRDIVSRPIGLTGLIIVVIVLALGIFGPMIVPYSPTAIDTTVSNSPPSLQHWFGTDTLGRDILSRTLSGILVSLKVGILSVAIGAAVGIPLGLVSGYFRPVDAVMSRIVELIMAFPGLVLALGLAAILGHAGSLNILIALSVAMLPSFIRITRGEVFRLRNLEFVEAAVTIGAPNRRILARHLLPNSFSALLVQITVHIPGAVLGEAALSFLGLGVVPPAPSLGVMLSEAQGDMMRGIWWEALFPGIAILAITIGFNLFGDALTDALDPKTRRD